MLTMLLPGCGPDKDLLMETKLDASLRQRMIALRDAERPDTLAVFGKCNATINGTMRQSLLDAGADVQTLANDIFTALIPSSALLNVAALEFVTQLQLSQTSKPLSR
jgi:type IV pilus biogenesis protein CpaD/CtpE